MKDTDILGVHFEKGMSEDEDLYYPYHSYCLGIRFINEHFIHTYAIEFSLIFFKLVITFSLRKFFNKEYNENIG